MLIYVSYSNATKALLDSTYCQKYRYESIRRFIDTFHMVMHLLKNKNHGLDGEIIDVVGILIGKEPC